MISLLSYQAKSHSLILCPVQVLATEITWKTIVPILCCRNMHTCTSSFFLCCHCHILRTKSVQEAWHRMCDCVYTVTVQSLTPGWSWKHRWPTLLWFPTLHRTLFSASFLHWAWEQGVWQWLCLPVTGLTLTNLGSLLMPGESETLS